MVCSGAYGVHVRRHIGRCTALRGPAGQCLVADSSTCGSDGACDGAGKCRLWALGTSCKPTTCMNATQTLAARCNGAGVCVNGTTQTCDPYQCGTGGNCLSVCNGANGNLDCTTGNTCTGMSCGKKGLGASCGSAPVGLLRAKGSAAAARLHAYKSCALAGSAGTC